jgi:hypothetical protein
MPRRRVHKRRIGTGFRDFMGKAKNFLQRTKLLSRVGSALQPLVPAQYSGLANMGLNYAKSQGYGRRRRGGALYPVGARRMRRGMGCCGGALTPAGGMRMSRKIIRPRLPKRMVAAY